MSVALDFFCLPVAVTMLSSAELSVYIEVGDLVKPSSWSVLLGVPLFDHCGIVILLLLRPQTH